MLNLLGKFDLLSVKNAVIHDTVNMLNIANKISTSHLNYAVYVNSEMHSKNNILYIFTDEDQRRKIHPV